MRNYKIQPSSEFKRPYTSAKTYANRESTEWDLRVDLVDGLTADAVVASTKTGPWAQNIQYVLISNVEVPDTHLATQLAAAPGPLSGSTDLHVHVALVTNTGVNRLTALQMIRGMKKYGAGNSEYAVPRNRKFSYAGWVAHHAKTMYKLHADAPTILHEHGDLPMDSFDEATCWQVVKMCKKFKSPGIRDRFIAYSNKLTEIQQAKQAQADSEAYEDSNPTWDGIPSVPDVHVRNLPESFATAIHANYNI